MTTIKDIAAKANVSIKTVSRVINGESGVSDATRQHVQVIIREMDYVPNLSAQRLKRGKLLPRTPSRFLEELPKEAHEVVDPNALAATPEELAVHTSNGMAELRARLAAAGGGS